MVSVARGVGAGRDVAPRSAAAQQHIAQASCSHRFGRPHGNVGGAKVMRERLARLELLEAFTADHLKQNQEDLEIPADLVRLHPDQFLSCRTRLSGKDFDDARKLEGDIGLCEQASAARRDEVLPRLVQQPPSAHLLRWRGFVTTWRIQTWKNGATVDL